jgi:hypothetical protein
MGGFLNYILLAHRSGLANEKSLGDTIVGTTELAYVSTEQHGRLSGCWEVMAECAAFVFS